ncbi:unnamed protein product [Pocillopora meandrina]|uniref:Granulins domain-containing protein n=1 Tax=Pocillopora meandrina TaxID=46732 RepID=A0AAU9WWD3_9CNID|nr:unnamed protein product [Pocillopora meandrina]
MQQSVCLPRQPDGRTKASHKGLGLLSISQLFCHLCGIRAVKWPECNIEKKTCDRKTDIETLLTKIQAWKGETGKSNIICSDGQSECPEGDTCCKLQSGQYGCCPLPKAVCCSDGEHCCPNGYTCDVSAGTCTQGSSSLPMVKKMSSSKRESIASNIVCPDGQSECPEGSTCCKLSSGEYGCCPLPKAVCCSDGVHCCPNGYTCDVSAGTCTQGSSSLPILKKMLALKQESAASNIVCPDGQSQCPDGNTCCKLPSGEYGCCPLPKAVCCSDGVHCCPNGYTCDVRAGTCTQGSSSLPLVKKMVALKQESAASNKVCPDGQSECPEGNTCCKLTSGEYGCCPLPNAVCCSDGVHCCPNGYAPGRVLPGPVRKELSGYQWLRKRRHQNKEVQRVTKFVPMVSPNVQREALAVNSLQVNMAVVLCQMLFVAAMEYTAVPMDILVTCLLEPVRKEAAVYQWLRKFWH